MTGNINVKRIKLRGLDELAKSKSLLFLSTVSKKKKKKKKKKPT